MKTSNAGKYLSWAANDSINMQGEKKKTASKSHRALQEATTSKINIREEIEISDDQAQAGGQLLGKRSTRESRRVECKAYCNSRWKEAIAEGEPQVLDAIDDIMEAAQDYALKCLICHNCSQICVRTEERAQEELRKQGTWLHELDEAVGRTDTLSSYERFRGYEYYRVENKYLMPLKSLPKLSLDFKTTAVHNCKLITLEDLLKPPVVVRNLIESLATVKKDNRGFNQAAPLAVDISHALGILGVKRVEVVTMANSGQRSTVSDPGMSMYLAHFDAEAPSSEYYQLTKDMKAHRRDRQKLENDLDEKWEEFEYRQAYEHVWQEQEEATKEELLAVLDQLRDISVRKADEDRLVIERLQIENARLREQLGENAHQTNTKR